MYKRNPSCCNFVKIIKEPWLRKQRSIFFLPSILIDIASASFVLNPKKEQKNPTRIKHKIGAIE